MHILLKSDKCLLDKEGTLKLIYFGFSAPQYGVCLLAQFCGTYVYLAPEILLLKPYNGFAVDIWSTGVILYTMVYGCLPFDGSCLEMVAKQLVQGL